MDTTRSAKMLDEKGQFEELLYKISLPHKENYTRNANDSLSQENNVCHITPVTYNTTIGILIAVPEWEAITTALILSTLIIGTIFGNILVILGVFTHRPLRIVQNFFIVSLAVADLTVAILVLPFNVAYSIFGRWLWGEGLCKMWLTCDILCCTSSILNLCVIALDRYWAITDPINYANKRTFKRVIALIAGVWILSLLISSPPLLGWNDWIDEFTEDTPCRLTSERGYVVYSSSGSFFIPLIIMTIVYLKIYIATKQRLRRRTQATKACAGNDKPAPNQSGKDELELQDMDSMNSESNPMEENDSESSGRAKRCQKKEFSEIKKNFFAPLMFLKKSDSRNGGETDKPVPETVENSSSSSSNKILTVVRRMSNRKSKRDKRLLASVDKKGDVVHQFIEQKQKISLSKERRAARTLGIIMGVFVVCWLPFFLMYVILAFCESCCATDRLINFITWLGYVNSTINPLIYTIFNLDFRKAFKNLLTSKKN